MGRSMGKEKGRVGTKRTCADIGGRGFEKSKTLRTSLADGIHWRALACVTYWVAFGGGVAGRELCRACCLPIRCA